MARLAIRVAGGTGAGCRTPPVPAHEAWVCANGHENKGAWTRCLTPSCNVKRPKP